MRPHTLVRDARIRLSDLTFVLIAMLAVACTFILLDLQEAAAMQLVALAAAILALGLVDWLDRDQEDRRSFERHLHEPQRSTL